MVGKMINCDSLDTVRIEVLGESRAHSINADVILRAVENQESQDEIARLKNILRGIARGVNWAPTVLLEAIGDAT